MKRSLAMLCVVATLVLTACSSGDDSEPEPPTQALPEPGQCVAREAKDLDTVAPNFASVVDCTKPHVYEIVDVLKVPKKFLVSGSRERRLERRTELAKSTGAGSLAKEFRAHSDHECHASVRRATGLEHVRIGKKSALEADVRPALLGARVSTNAGPADQWVAGKPRIICSFRYTLPAVPTDPPARHAAIRSPSTVPIYRDLLSEYFPAERRACGSYDEDNYMYAVLCTSQHNTEVLFSYDAGLAFGTTFAESVDASAITDAQWDKLVTPCADSLIGIVGVDIDDELVGSVYLADDWDRSLLAICLITPLDDELDLPPGSVVGRAGAVKEVPTRKVDGGLGDYAQGT